MSAIFKRIFNRRSSKRDFTSIVNKVSSPSDKFAEATGRIWNLKSADPYLKAFGKFCSKSEDERTAALGKLFLHTLKPNLSLKLSDDEKDVLSRIESNSIVQLLSASNKSVIDEARAEIFTVLTIMALGGFVESETFADINHTVLSLANLKSQGFMS